MAKTTLGRVLVVDDEVELMNVLCETLSEQGYETVGETNPKAGLKALSEGEFDLLLSDLMMPGGMDGIQLLRKALEIDPNLVGIIMTGQGTIQTAVEAMKIGAFDYILKPFDLQTLLPILRRAMDVRRLRVENVRLRRYIEATFESPRYQLVGSSQVMQRVIHLIEKVAPSDATVLVRGASGTGKELVARALHHNSSRRDKPLVTINCAALQETLLESELFGHEKGAFTGAGQTKPGLIEVADSGTLFIDEVAEMAPAMQAKLLRVLEDGHYRRVGGTQEHHADVRVIAATNKPLEEEQKAGRFREDLYYRLNVVTIPLPPLRERRQDIQELIAHFLTTRQMGKVPYQVAPEALETMQRYDWPGNVRELANVLERAQILAEDNLITVDDLPENMLLLSANSPAPSSPNDLRDLERRHVLDVLRQMKGNKVQAAKALGISRRALYRLVEKYQLKEAAGPEAGDKGGATPPSAGSPTNETA